MSNPRHAEAESLFAPPGAPPVQWLVSPGLTRYEEAVALMEALAEAIAVGRAAERVWLLEHPPLYTAGTSAKPEDLLDPRFPVFRAGRGGQFTYHGPGQRVAYVMLDLKRRRPDLRAYVAGARGLADRGARGLRRRGRDRARTGSASGSRRPDKPRGLDGAAAEDKIAAIGVRVRRWATFHGVSLNVAPDLSHFSGIVPCGISEAHFGVTSLADLGRGATLADVDQALRASFETDVRSDGRRRATRPFRRRLGLKGNAWRRPLRWRGGRSGAAPMRCRRFGTERLETIAALHYALIGERRGYRPNGFFDPGFFRRRAGLSAKADGLLGLYLAEDGTGAAPSAEFHPAWYAAQNPQWRKTHPHPFLHFLEVGLRSGRRPRPDIDMAFVRDVVRGKGRSLEEAAMRVFDPKPRDGDMKPPLSHEELRARQDRFYAETRMRIAREAPGAGRKLLVFVQCGRGFAPKFLAARRDYDLMLNCYEETDADPRADTVVFQGGTKTTAIRRLLDERPDLLLRYEAALFLDDDVEIGAGDIQALFATAARERLDLAHPALTADFDFGMAISEKAERGRRNYPGVDGRDHGPAAYAAGSRAHRLGLFTNRQRLGNRSRPRSGRARGVRSRRRRRHRLGRRPPRA